MDLTDLGPLLDSPGPFVTVHVPTASNREQSAAEFDLQWREVVRQLSDRGLRAGTVEAVAAARGDHADGESRYVIADDAAEQVRLAVSLDTSPPAPSVEIAPLPRLLPLVDDLASRATYVVAVVDREGGDVRAWVDGRPLGDLGPGDDGHHYIGRGQARRDQGAVEDNWRATAKTTAEAVVAVTRRVGASLVLLTGEPKVLADVRAQLPADLPEVVDVRGTRNTDGSEELRERDIRDTVARHAALEVLELLGDYAQERGQRKRACDGVQDVVEALRKAQVQTLLITTAAVDGETLWFGPEPTQLGLTAQDVRDLGADVVRQGPLVDVLLRAAIGTGADAQLVPAEPEQAPRGGIGALLRYADA